LWPGLLEEKKVMALTWLTVKLQSMFSPKHCKLLFELSKRDADAIIRPGPMVQGSDGMALQKKVWDQLVRQLENIQPGISQNI
jgi:hypothetical protein